MEVNINPLKRGHRHHRHHRHHHHHHHHHRFCSWPWWSIWLSLIDLQVSRQMFSQSYEMDVHSLKLSKPWWLGNTHYFPFRGIRPRISEVNSLLLLQRVSFWFRSEQPATSLPVLCTLDMFCLVIFYGFYHGKSPLFTTIWGNVVYFFPTTLRSKSKVLHWS